MTETKSQKIARYWKAIVAAVGAVTLIGNEVAEVVIQNYGDGVWDQNDTMTVVVALLIAVGVYFKGNRPVAKEGAVLLADLSDPLKDRYEIFLGEPPENLVGKEFVTLKVESKLE